MTAVYPLPLPLDIDFRISDRKYMYLTIRGSAFAGLLERIVAAITYDRDGGAGRGSCSRSCRRID